MIELISLLLVVLKVFVLPYGIFTYSRWSVPLLVFTSFFFPTELYGVETQGISFKAMSNLYILFFLLFSIVYRGNGVISVPKYLWVYLIFIMVSILKIKEYDYFSIKTVFIYIYTFVAALYVQNLSKTRYLDLLYVAKYILFSSIALVSVMLVWHPEAFVSWGGRTRLSIGFGASALALLWVPSFIVFLSYVLLNKKGWIYLISISVLIFMTQSRSALGVMIMSTVLAILVIFITNGARRNLIRAIPVVFFLTIIGGYLLLEHLFSNGASYSLGAISTSGRLDTWMLAIDMILQSPISGYGTGGSERWLAEMGSHLAHPHNEYIRLIFDLGIMAFVFAIIPLVVYFYFIKYWFVMHILMPKVMAAGLSVPVLLVIMIADDVGIFSFVLIQMYVIWVGVSGNKQAVNRLCNDVSGKKYIAISVNS